MNKKTSISIELDSGDVLTIHVVGESENSIRHIERAEADEHLEAPVQIIEGYRYEYNLDKSFRLQAEGGIIIQSKLNLQSGRIEPGIYVGTLQIFIKDECGNDVGQFEMEVRSSKKADYHTEYRFMLEEITEKCTDLLMQYTSPANQPFDIDHDNDPQTLYQRFAFLKSILDSEGFWTAVHRVTTNPVTVWRQTEEKRDIRSVKRMNRNIVRQFTEATNRIPLPEEHALKKYMGSIPEKVTTRGKVDTVDTPENRFVKYALETFKTLCGDFKSASRNGTRLNKEAERLEEKLEETLNHSIFQKISRPSTLPLNSPVLQRKEGYREILRVWLMVNLAARLTWKGGEDVYKGGKRDVATLYEYWLFFKLTDLLEGLFEIQALTPDRMIEETKDKLGLKLKQGKHLPLEGVYEKGNRKLHVQFSFNKTFNGDNKYPSGGSWTRSMRPDYTLSIWPECISETKAEKQDLIVHLHFDAKYKVENLTSLFGKDDEDLNEEKQEQNKGTYKRADLLKMHSYRDSIRRTAGAYILYPGGDGIKDWRGFHEIIPGLGAFTMRPNRDNDGSSELRLFLEDVIQHFLNRSSQREKLSSRINQIHENSTPYIFKKEVPEFIGKRKIIPDEVFVVIGYYNDNQHLRWIKENSLYNVRYNTGRGGVSLTGKVVSASYLLLRGPNNMETDQIYKLKKSGPVLYSSKELIGMGYPREEKTYSYLVYKIQRPADEDFNYRKWNVRKVKGYNSARSKSTKPLLVSLAELMEAEI